MLMSASPPAYFTGARRAPPPMLMSAGRSCVPLCSSEGPAPYANEREPLRRTSPGPGEPRPLC